MRRSGVRVTQAAPPNSLKYLTSLTGIGVGLPQPCRRGSKVEAYAPKSCLLAPRGHEQSKPMDGRVEIAEEMRPHFP